ncbi:MAG: BatA domain-containing protein [Opitutales bacterium]
MNFFFANPAGFWGLLALPAIVAIYLFQRKARRVPVATSFLLEPQARVSYAGRRLAFWRHSWAFWLQMLAALLLGLLLAQPRWLREDSQQRVALVLDDSASMQAFRSAAAAAVESVSAELASTAATTQFLLRGSRAESDRLYGGDNRLALLEALDGWQPTHGAHPIEPALQAARLAAGTEGRVIFVTDHAAIDLPADIEVLAVGEPTDNVGIAGIRVRENEDQVIWQAVLRNYSNAAQTRAWWVEGEDVKTAQRALTLAPGGASTISGRFPDGAEKLSLRLENDALPIDDHAPLVAPKPRPVSYRLYGEAGFNGFVREVLDLLAGVRWGQGAEADLALALSAPGRLRELPSAPHEVHFGNQSSGEGSSMYNPQALVEFNPLVEGLSLDGLVFPVGGGNLFELPQQADVLIWDNTVPLVFLEPLEEGRRLVFNFDVPNSNLDRLPGFVILLQRFIEQIRSEKASFWQENFELGQILPLPPVNGEFTLETSDRQEPLSLPARAPSAPAFFAVALDSKPLLEGATQFLDVREADLRRAASHDGVSGSNRAAAVANSTQDFLLPLWVLLGVALLLASYHLSERNA